MNERAVFKCRGIREDTGEWVTGYAIPDEITGQMFIFPPGNSVNESPRVGEEGCLRFWAYEIVPESLCYFTEMTDKKGTQIYEKDIVKNSKGQIGEIVWIPSFCGFFIKCREGTESFDDSVIDIEVIGNTVKSPGLLEGRNKMGRLIDESAVIKAIDKHTRDDGVLDDDISVILEEVPTAFDKGRIIRGLEELQALVERCKKKCKLGSTEYFNYTGEEVAYKTAISIVERGGVD